MLEWIWSARKMSVNNSATAVTQFNWVWTQIVGFRGRLDINTPTVWHISHIDIFNKRPCPIVLRLYLVQNLFRFKLSNKFWHISVSFLYFLLYALIWEIKRMHVGWQIFIPSFDKISTSVILVNQLKIFPYIQNLTSYI